MKENKGLTLISLIVSIILIFILAGVSINFIIGDNGILTKAMNVEKTFNKSEVLEEINVMITEKYLDAYNKASSNISQNGGLDVEKYYSGDKVIKFLQGYSGGDSGEEYGENVQPDKPVVIVELKDTSITNNAENGENCYFINLDSLNRNINKYGKGTNFDNSKDYFYIKGSGETYKLYYKNLEGNSEEIGDLQIQQNL